MRLNDKSFISEENDKINHKSRVCMYGWTKYKAYIPTSYIYMLVTSSPDSGYTYVGTYKHISNYIHM